MVGMHAYVLLAASIRGPFVAWWRNVESLLISLIQPCGRTIAFLFSPISLWGHLQQENPV